VNLISHIKEQQNWRMFKIKGAGQNIGDKREIITGITK
jgi:hypothetical protein